MENMKEYEEICGKYEGIFLLFRLWDLDKFRDLPLYIGFGTYTNSELFLPVQAVGLGNIPSFPSLFKL